MLTIPDVKKSRFHKLCMNSRGRGGGGYSTKFYTGRLCPKVQPLQPLTLLNNMFDWEGSPSIHVGWYPFHTPSLELCIHFNCCKCTALKIRLNHKTRMFSWHFHSHKMHLLALLGLFTDQNERFSYPFIFFSQWNPYPFKNLKLEKLLVPLLGGAPLHRPS